MSQQATTIARVGPSDIEHSTGGAAAPVDADDGFSLSAALPYLLIGILFGVVMLKSGAASWFRIYEMFTFGSFHMYGIIGSALACGLVFTQVVKRLGVRGFGPFGKLRAGSRPIVFRDKDRTWARYALGGTVFGLGWAVAGACPGPMFTLVGAGLWPILVVIASAVAGTYLYGRVRGRLPH